MNTLELTDKIEQLTVRGKSIMKTAKAEMRKLNTEEQTEFDQVTKDLKETKAQLEEVKRNLNKETNKQEKRMKQFSILKAVNDVVNNRNFDENTQEVLNAGVAEMRKAGQSFSGQIQIPTEKRAVVAGVEGAGAEAVATDVMQILGPNRPDSLINQVGATVLTGLTGNIQIPRYDGTNVTWEGETAAAKDGAGAMDSIKLTPKRLTAYIDISKQFLIQDAAGAEAMLRADIVNAVNQKLEETIFGNTAGDATKPAGVFLNAAVGAPTYESVLGAEEKTELANVKGNKVFVVSPKAKHAFKTATISGTKNDLRMVMEGNEIDGYPVYTSSLVGDTNWAFGNFNDLVVAQWGGIDLTVDPYTQADKGCVRLVINCYFDAAMRNADSVAAYKKA